LIGRSPVNNAGGATRTRIATARVKGSHSAVLTLRAERRRGTRGGLGVNGAGA
jgi:hypothetical protein